MKFSFSALSWLVGTETGESNVTLQGTASVAPGSSVAPVTDVAHFSDDAVCYAERYPDLWQGYCKGGSAKCKVEGLLHHYENHGKDSDLIWGCRDRNTVSATPVAFAGLDEDVLQLHVLVFETDPTKAAEMMIAAQSLAAGIQLTVFGINTKFEGFGTKWDIVKPVLAEVEQDKLVAIVDGRDVLLNIHKDDMNQGRDIIEGFSQAYQALTAGKPGAVVMSTEGQCCVSALTFQEPGAYFDYDGYRKERACASGEEGCLWNGDVHKLPWEDFQQDLAKNRTGLDLEDVYLNAGLVAGRPNDLLRVIETADMLVYEDDQAVFTDFMYMFPDLVVLDYAQQLFGNARWSHGMTPAGCPFERHSSVGAGSLMHIETKTMPLVLHGPGKFFECLDFMAEQIGHGDENTSSGHLRASAGRRELLKNYGGPKPK